MATLHRSTLASLDFITLDCAKDLRGGH